MEDDFLLADMLTGMLEEHGAIVVGPVASVEDGINLANAERLDAAILDIKLRGGTNAFPIADALARRAVPFVFLTAYDDSIVPPALAGRPPLRKPLDPVALPRLLETHFRN